MEDKEFYFIYTSPGADMATEKVSWHSDVDGTFVEYAPAAKWLGKRSPR